MAGDDGASLGSSYRLLERVGRGATGDVWRTLDVRSQTVVAAKLLRSELVEDHRLVARFVGERSLLTGLRHPNIVAVRDLVVEGDQLAIIMDYLPGGSLRSILKAPLPPATAVALAAQVLDGLSHAHRRDVVHRDVKPDNVLLTENWSSLPHDAARLGDFGIARLLSERRAVTSGLLGTPAYMAPELIVRGEAGSASDVYSAGILLYELLAGVTPFAGPGNDFTVAHRHVTSTAAPLPVPSALDGLLTDLLNKDAESRPTASEAAERLRALAPDVADLPALTASGSDDGDAGPQGTVVRGGSGSDTGEETSPWWPGPHNALEPDLGSAPEGTRVRAIPAASAGSPPPGAKPAVPTPAPRRVQPGWFHEHARTLLVAGGAVATLALVVGLSFTPWFRPAPAPSPAATATVQDSALPTGLGVTRTATYDPDSETVKLTLTYSAQNAPLEGPFFEIIPAVNDEGDCPTVTWDTDQVRNLASVTGLDDTCSWAVDVPTIARQGTESVTATVSLTDLGDDTATALETWLHRESDLTLTALQDPDLSTTAYPVQRLQDIDVLTPAREVTQKTLDVTLVPVWPSGADEVHPLYTSPATGSPTTMLTAIAGGEDGVRFSDGCSGALAVSGDGLVVTTLQMTPSCVLNARVGNFADLSSAPFAITTRGG